jgi:putative SOS response-associated peptidase YedK
VATKPAVREALKKRRCLIPADGFHEWKKEGKTKTPFCFTMADNSIFAFAGIWETWKNPEGRLVETCSIITTKPNALCADVHDRMFCPTKPTTCGSTPASRKRRPSAIC